MPLRSIVWNPHQDQYFSAFEGSLIKLYDIHQQRIVRFRNQHNANDAKIKCMAWSQNTSTPLVMSFACEDGTLRLCDLNPSSDEVTKFTRVVCSYCRYRLLFQSLDISIEVLPTSHGILHSPTSSQ